MRRMEGLPRSVAMRWIRTGQVRVDMRRCKPFVRLSRDQIVRIPPHEDFLPGTEKKFNSNNNRPELNIIHCEKDFLLIDKPAGLAVHSGTGTRESLALYLKSAFSKDNFAPTPVHRLDKPTSGVILIARTYPFLRKMHEKWKSNAVKKYYLAWVSGNWTDENEIQLQDKLVKDRASGKVGANQKGKKARCLVRPLLRQSGMSLLQILLLTGRTHQIRAQLSLRAHPVLGDRQYGGEEAKRLYLHAVLLDWGEKKIACLPDWDGIFTVPTDLLSLPE